MSSNTIYNCLERLSELLRVDSRQVIAEHGLQPVQLEVLHYLSICNRFSDTPMAVTDYLGQTKGTVSQTLKVLEKKELLSKKTDKNDKRISHLIVSNKGKRLLKNTIPTPMLSKASSALPERKLKEIESSLKLLLISLQQENDIKTYGVCHSCRYNIKNEDGDYYCKLVKQSLSAEEINLICKEHED